MSVRSILTVGLLISLAGVDVAAVTALTRQRDTTSRLVSELNTSSRLLREATTALDAREAEMRKELIARGFARYDSQTGVWGMLTLEEVVAAHPEPQLDLPTIPEGPLPTKRLSGKH